MTDTPWTPIGGDDCELLAAISNTEVAKVQQIARLVEHRCAEFVRNHADREVKALLELLAVADCRYCHGQGWYEDEDNRGRPRQRQCEWCDRVKTALDAPVNDADEPF